MTLTRIQLFPLHLIGRRAWKHENGTTIQAADYNGYRALTPSKQRRFFLAVNPGDLSLDWLDITDHIGNFIVAEKTPVPDRLARKLGLLQSPGKAMAQRFARRTRELQSQCRTVDQASITAASEIFPGEFQPTRYSTHGDDMGDLLADIERL